MYQDFAALDVETANSNRDSICSLGIALFKNGELVNKYYSLINPHQEFDDINIAINNITSEDVKNCPTFSEVWSQVNNEFKNVPIVTHTSFDIYAIKQNVTKNNINFNDEINFFDSFLISRRLVGGAHHRLKDLASKYQIHNDCPHNALHDAITCGKVVLSLMKENNTYSIDDICNLAGYDHLGKLSSQVFKPFSHYSGKHNKVQYHLTDDDFIEANDIIDLSDNVASLYDKNVVFTGTLKSMKRAKAQQIVEEKGGHFQKGINKKTNLLIIGIENKRVVGSEGKSSKILKAEKLNSEGCDIEIIDESDFLKLI